MTPSDSHHSQYHLSGHSLIMHRHHGNAGSVGGKKNRHRMVTWWAIGTDLILWSLIIVLGFSAVEWYQKWRGISQGEVIRLSFGDANELTRGANVRMMGVDVGHVARMILKPDHVDVVLRTNRGTLPVPERAEATIEFTGLVGAKSLELMVPDASRKPPASLVSHVNDKSHYLVLNPIRLKDTFRYQIEIAQALELAAKNFDASFGRQKSLEEHQININDANRNTEKAVTILGRSSQRIQLFRRQARQTYDDVHHTLQQIASGSGQAAELMNPDYFVPAVAAVSRHIREIALDHSQAIEDFKASGSLEHLNKQNIRPLNHRLVRFAQQADPVVARVIDHNPIRRPVGAFNQAMAVVDESRVARWPARAHNLDEAIRRFNQQLVGWNHRF